MPWPFLATVPFLVVFGSVTSVLIAEVLATDETATTWIVVLAFLAAATQKRDALSSWLACGAVALSLAAASSLALAVVFLWVVPRG